MPVPAVPDPVAFVSSRFDRNAMAARLTARRREFGTRRLSRFEPAMGQFEVCETLRTMSSDTAPTITPTPQNGTVPPRPIPHAERRPREYLTPKEVERLITAARQNRYGHRDATMIRVAYRHGLRVSELCALR